jgi:2-phosphoglycolate phosphatase
MLAPRAIVFDLDGTLIDSRGDIAAAMTHAFAVTGRRTVPGSSFLRFVGDGARMLCARAASLPEKDPQVDKLLEAYLEYYVDHPTDHTKWMPHAREVLDKLRDYPLALCTNKSRVSVEAILSRLGVRSLFAAIAAGDDAPERKPQPEPLLSIASRLGLQPAQLVIVGDGPQDVDAGRRAGTRTVGVIGVFVPRDRLSNAQPDVLLDSLQELPDIIARWSDATVRAR